MCIRSLRWLVLATTLACQPPPDLATVTLKLAHPLELDVDATITVDNETPVPVTFGETIALDVQPGLSRKFILRAWRGNGDNRAPVYFAETVSNVPATGPIIMLVHEVARVRGRLVAADDANVTTWSNVQLTLTGDRPYVDFAATFAEVLGDGRYDFRIPADSYVVTGTALADGVPYVVVGAEFNASLGEVRDYDVTLQPVDPELVAITLTANGLPDGVTVTVADTTTNETYTLTNNATETIEVNANTQYAFIATASDTLACTVNNASGIATQNITVSVLCVGGVSCRYAADGACKWTNFVKTSAPGTPCDAGTAQNYDDCLHVAEFLEISLADANYTSCDNITASDSLDALVWQCEDNGTFVRSTGLNDKGLWDLIDDTSLAWWENKVTIIAPDGKRATPLETWWDNAIVADTPIQADKIVVLTQPCAAKTSVGASNVAIVALPWACDASAADASLDNSPLLTINNGVSFVWIEGELARASGQSPLIHAGSGAFTVLRKLTLTTPGSAIKLDGTRASWITASDINASGATNTGMGIALLGATNNRISNVTVRDFYYGINVMSGSTGNVLDTIFAVANVQNGILVEGDENTFEDLVLVATVPGTGLRLLGSDENSARRNVVRGVRAFGNEVGVALENADDTIVAGLTAFNNGTGLDINQSDGTVIINGTLANATSDNISVNSSGVAHFINVAAVNGGVGMYIQESTVRTANVAVLDNSIGFEISDVNPDVGTNIEIHGQLVLGNDTDCTGNTTRDNNLVVESDGSCTPAFATAGNVLRGRTAAEAFVGVITTDAVNVAAGETDPEEILAIDPARFDNPFRGWTVAGTFPEPDVRGKPDWFGTSSPTPILVVFDWRLKDAGDGAILLNAVAATPALANPVGQVPIRWTANSAETCAEYPGATWISTQVAFEGCVSDAFPAGIESESQTSTSMPLLCESGDTCIFSSNIGSYQGEGELLGPDTFNFGAATYTLWEYPEHAAPN